MVIRLPLVPITLSAKAISDCRTDVNIEQHCLVMDEPESRKGTDLGPTPLDTLVAALAGCTNVVLKMIASDIGVSVSNLGIQIDSALDVRGILGIEIIDTPIPEIRLGIRFDSDGDVASIEILMSCLRQRCAVAVILRQAGISIKESWTVNGQPV